MNLKTRLKTSDVIIEHDKFDIWILDVLSEIEIDLRFLMAEDKVIGYCIGHMDGFNIVVESQQKNIDELPKTSIKFCEIKKVVFQQEEEIDKPLMTHNNVVINRLEYENKILTVFWGLTIC
jgi:hypothetical protein